MQLLHTLHKAVVVAVFGPIYLTGVVTFGLLEGRTGVEEITAEFRKIIPTESDDAAPDP